MKIRFVSLLLLLSLDSFATVTTADAFFNRFEVRRNDKGAAHWILIRYPKKWTGEEVIQTVRKDLELYARMPARSVDSSLKVLAAENGLNSEQLDTLRTALKTLNQQNLNAVFSDRRMKELAAEIDRKFSLKDLVNPFQVVANLTDPFYFYKAAIITSLVDELISYAEKLFLDDVPAVSVANFVIGRVKNWIRQRQSYYRQMAIYYLDAFGPEALGLTPSEGRWLLSSIYSSGLGWKDGWQAIQINNHWNDYGFENLSAAQNACSLKHDLSASTWLAELGVYTYAFERVKTKNGNQILNMQVSKSKYDSSPSITWYEKDPIRNRNERVLLMALELALKFVPSGGWIGSEIKGEITSFIKSLYGSQIKSEGALVGYFESIGDMAMARHIADQSINPFLLVELAQPPRPIEPTGPQP